MTASDLLLLLSIGVVQLLAVISPGPSFLITARTAVARSRLDGVKVALGLAAGTVIWSSAALLGLNAVFHASFEHHLHAHANSKYSSTGSQPLVNDARGIVSLEISHN